MTFFAELKRRNVFRVGAAYVVVGWLLLQVADVLLGNFGAPDWVFKSFAAMLALGLPLALFLAWAFELTPDGVKRTEVVDADESIAPSTGRRLDRFIVVGLLGVIALLVIERVWFASAPILGPEEASEPGVVSDAAVVDKSIAVLPFSDFSPGGDSRWFADGLSEEILNSLVRVPDLLVAARTSSFNFRDSSLPIPEIADELGVAHVLEGSVRMAGDRVRVTAQLIRADDGFHVWSDTFDRETADMIGIQEDLAHQIARAMETTMDPDALIEMSDVGTQSVEAYKAYLRGRAIEEFGGHPQAYALFEKARQIDPAFSRAHFLAARYWQIQSSVTRTDAVETGLTAAEMAARFVERIDAAIASASSEEQRLLYQGLKARFQLRISDAKRLFEAYLAERPGDMDAWNELVWLSNIMGDDETVVRGLRALMPNAEDSASPARFLPSVAYRLNDTELAKDEVQRTLPLLERWPLDASLHYQMHRALLWIGDFERARDVHDRIFEVGMAVSNPALVRLRQACADGRTEDAQRIYAEAISDDRNERWLGLLLLGETDAAYDYLRPIADSGNLFALSSYLLYPQFDARRFPDLMQLLKSEGIERPEPEAIPFACKQAEVDA